MVQQNQPEASWTVQLHKTAIIGLKFFIDKEESLYVNVVKVTTVLCSYYTADLCLLFTIMQAVSFLMWWFN